MTPPIVQPMPDEPAAAHAGRLALFMGIGSQAEFEQWLRSAAHSLPAATSQTSRLEQLAAAVGMDSLSYAQQHSMLGVLRVAAQSKKLAAHGAIAGSNFSRRLGMLTQKPQSHICPKCVEEDLEHWHFSWFRRSHQLQGVDACLLHRTPLLKVRSSASWSMLPHHWLESGEVEESKQATGWIPTAFETRFGEVACAMLQRTAPYPLEPFVAAMSSRARYLGLRTSTNGVKSNLSDWIREVTPVEWTSVHWPELNCKPKGEFFFSLDSVLNCRTVASTGFAYVTALTALWDTSEEMYQTLTDLGHHPIEKASEKQSNLRGSTYWQGEIWEAYRKHQGRVRAMAPDLGVSATHLREKLNQLGLPSLHDVATSVVWRAYLRFEAGEPLLSACEAEGIDIGAVEPLIRLSCARVAVAARDILKPGQKTTEKIKRRSNQITKVQAVHLPATDRESDIDLDEAPLTSLLVQAT